MGIPEIFLILCGILILWSKIKTSSIKTTTSPGSGTSKIDLYGFFSGAVEFVKTFLPIVLGVGAYAILMFLVLPEVFPKFWDRWYGNPRLFLGTNLAFVLGIILEAGLKKDIGRWISIMTWLFIFAKCVAWPCLLCSWFD